MPLSWLSGLLGGALIGAASALLLVAHGRIAGISGIVGSLVGPAPSGPRSWKLAFLGGLALSGLVARAIAPSAIGPTARSALVVALAGLLVGVGTTVGSGCTSGHGVCGLSRLSPRSLVAVLAFMVTGAITVALVGGAR